MFLPKDLQLFQMNIKFAYFHIFHEYHHIVKTKSIINGNRTVTFTGLNYNTKYYWKASNGTDEAIQEFTTINASITPGQLNITVFDEMTFELLSNFSINLFNATHKLSKNTTTGWINFSSIEVSSGSYITQINSSGYYSRYVIISSPGSYNLFLPALNESLAQITFTLNDFTNLFPFETSKLNITKYINNKELIASNYFDISGKITVVLIAGEKYGISIESIKAVRVLSDFIPSQSENVNIMVGNITLQPEAGLNGYSDSLTFDNNFVYTWTDLTLEMIWLNVTIWDNSNNELYSINTTVHQGQITVPLSQAVRYSIKISTVHYGVIENSNGWNINIATDYQLTDLQTIPQWVKNTFSIIVLILFTAVFIPANAKFGMLLIAASSTILTLLGLFQIERIGTETTLTIEGILIVFAGLNLMHKE